MARKIVYLIAAFIITVSAQAQIREIPAPVKEAFQSTYPKASKVEYKDNITSVHVYFVQDSASMIAKYNNKGMWRETEKAWDYEKLGKDVQDGFDKSKYATDWKVVETKIVYRPTNKELYRLKIEKNDIQKKYLYFNKAGRLVEEAITL